MVLDYKDVSFSFQDRKLRRRRRLLWLLLLALLLLAAWLGLRCLKARAAVARIEDLLLAGRQDQAETLLQDAASPLFQRGNFRELQALSELFRGRLPEAAVRFAELRRRGLSTTLRSGRLLAHFFDRGEYDKLDLYSSHLLPGGGDQVRWFHALCRAAFLDADAAEKALAGLSATYRRANGKAVDMLSRFSGSLRSGRVDYVFDRNDVPLAYFDLQRRASRSLLPGMDFAAFEAQFKKGARFFHLTLDGGLQRRIDRLFQGHAGTLVLLDLPGSAIAAAYSKPGAGKPADAAFSERYEPGSIVKLVSLLAYLRRGGDGIFPMECPGHLAVDGGIIYDLERHGLVRDVSQALARSCNVGFARMGLAVGRSGLTELLQRFFFNAPAFSDRFLAFRTGRFASGGEAALARLAAGLDGVTLTTLHGAVLAAVFAQNGLHFPPFLIDDTKNLLGLGIYRHDPRPLRLLSDDPGFLRVKKAMAAVVEDDKGTGRRLAGSVPRLAVKTGTAPGKAGKLDAILIGFFPYDDPRYAFAFRLEGAGRAELRGVFFLQELLKLLYPR
ncbi:MAG: penicillin-binding transpeptidase domain-containing protein [Acidobacteria bacterium]|nr:penicillin-binding transpeptidase domain-containing protein [Acidobacteriota bacterium]